MLRRYPITGKKKFLDFEGKAYRLKCPSSGFLSKSVALFLQYCDSYRKKCSSKTQFLYLSDVAKPPKAHFIRFSIPSKGPKTFSN